MTSAEMVGMAYTAIMKHFEGEQTATKDTPLGAVMAVMQQSKAFVNRGANDFKEFTIECKQVKEASP